MISGETGRLDKNFAAADVNIGCLNPQLNKTRNMALYCRMIMTAQRKVILLCICKMHKIYLMKKCRIRKLGNGQETGFVMSEYKIGKIIVTAYEHRRRSFERIQCRKTVLGR
jgi:hypothetical protein